LRSAQPRLGQGSAASGDDDRRRSPAPYHAPAGWVAGLAHALHLAT
jgi:hypothetical protein